MTPLVRTNNMSEIKEGTKVRAMLEAFLHKLGPVVTVVKITDHCPIDGPKSPNSLAYLSDGSWEFIWNLEEV